MGRSHVTSGAVAFLSTSLAWSPDPHTLVLGTAVCAGAAVLPDIDHPGSGISRTFGPITGGFASVVAKLSGGHRNGTHSHLGAGIFSLLAFVSTALYDASLATLAIGVSISGTLVASGWLLGVTDKGKGRRKRAYKRRWHGYLAAWALTFAALVVTAASIRYGRAAGAVGLALLLILVLAAMIRVFRIKGYWDDFAPIPITAGLLYWEADLTIVPYAIVLGVMVHLAGDEITKGGCPVGWPWSQTMRGPGLFKTNSPTENNVVFPGLMAAFLGLAAYTVGVLDPIIRNLSLGG